MITKSWMRRQHAGMPAALRSLVLCITLLCLGVGTASMSQAADAADAHAADSSGAHAEDHSTPSLLSFDFGSAVCNLAIFLGVLGILSKFVWPVILDGLKAREDKIFDELKDAEEANTKAQGLLAD